jgi:hypothetical protein
MPPRIRGLHVLYQRKANRRGARGPRTRYEVIYIGIAGTGTRLRQGIRGRLRAHHQKRRDWTHFSALEVHDNVTREEIRELESLLLAIFRDDPRIFLENKQTGSTKLYELRKDRQWDGAWAQRREP